MNAGACDGDDGGEGRSENIRSERGQTSSDVLCSGSDSGGDNYGSTRTHSMCVGDEAVAILRIIDSLGYRGVRRVLCTGLFKFRDFKFEP